MSQIKPLVDLVKFEEPIASRISEETDTARFLRFPLAHDMSGLLPLDQLVEVIKVSPQEILPLPQVPDYLLGITNRRGEAIWLVDLLYLMGATHLSRRELVSEVCMAILVQAESQAIGLLVEQVHSIEFYNPQNLQPFPRQTLPSKLLTFLEGYFLDSEGNTLALFNVNSIIEVVENSEQPRPG